MPATLEIQGMKSSMSDQKISEKSVQKGLGLTGGRREERGDGKGTAMARLLLTSVFDQRAWKQEQIQLHPRIQYCSARPFAERVALAANTL